MSADEVDEVIDYIVEEVKPFVRATTVQLLIRHLIARKGPCQYHWMHGNLEHR